MKNKKLFAILTLVCFMFTLMPVAAFAGEAVADRSLLYVKSDRTTIDAFEDGTMTENEDAVKYGFTFRDNGDKEVKLQGVYLYVWAKDAAGNITSALDVAEAENFTAPQYAKVAYLDNAISQGELNIAFARAGEYTVYAGYTTAPVTKVSDITPLLGSGETVINVLGTNVNPETAYTLTVSPAKAGTAKDDFDWAISKVKPNNVAEEYTLAFKANDKALTGKTVTIETDSDNIVVDKATATTNYLGEVKINLSASREGDYTIYVTVDGKVFTITVECTNTSAAYIKTVEEPSALVAQFTNDFAGVTFEITDINGNAVTNAKSAGGAKGLYGKGEYEQAKYLYFVEKPAASKLKNSDLSLDAKSENGKYVLNVAGTLDAEGKYVVKAILDNGSVATAEWEVKRFQTPVALYIEVASTVELGKTLAPALTYVDANGVEKNATDAKLAATGYAIYSFDGNKIVLKTDEKYAGQSINLTAVSERYDLVGTAVVKIAAEATDIAFATESLDVNVNNKVVWNVVDVEGNKVKLNDVADYKVRYVVLDAPEGAKVSVYDLTDKNFTGEGEMALTSNKVGNVTVQAIAQVQVKTAAAKNELGATQTKYYTGTQIFAVGTEGVGDVVVMSIGSNEIVKNDKVATMIAAPIVENNRTFVPFRALAEAFGAEVAWDEATQAVTAELNGVTVVMTIGSVEYTINGEAATMDVAPFLGNDSTMVPVRFVAQAFGIKVIPTYDENGATADILFNL